jgi:anti-sigma factor RsiW
MADIIHLHPDQHEQIERLLPWYATGQIEPADRAKVEAHLPDCTRCQAELQAERRLSAAVRELPLDMELGWADLKARLDAPQPYVRRHGERIRGAIRGAAARPGKVAWFVAAQAAVVVAAVMLSAPTSQQPALYRTLGSAPATATGNVIVMFRPDTAERDLRNTLVATGARVTDGPTAAGAYVLQVPQARRDAALAQLRRQADVILAQPIDTPQAL